VLKQNLRATDLAGRYGGDEFCVILRAPSTARPKSWTPCVTALVALAYAWHPTLRASLSIGLAPINPPMATPPVG
jgi:diguanylate cyclase